MCFKRGGCNQRHEFGKGTSFEGFGEVPKLDALSITDSAFVAMKLLPVLQFATNQCHKGCSLDTGGAVGGAGNHTFEHRIVRAIVDGLRERKELERKCHVEEGDDGNLHAKQGGGGGGGKGRSGGGRGKTAQSGGGGGGRKFVGGRAGVDGRPSIGQLRLRARWAVPEYTVAFLDNGELYPVEMDVKSQDSNRVARYHWSVRDRFIQIKMGTFKQPLTSYGPVTNHPCPTGIHFNSGP